MRRDVQIASAALLCTVISQAVAVQPALKAIDAKEFDEIASLAITKKSEFERSKDFDDKRCAALSQALGLPLNAEIHIQHISGYRSSYDADRGQFDFELGYAAGAPSKPGFYVTIAKRITSLAPYVGSNAYGVSKRIEVREEEYVALFVPSRSMASSIHAVLKTTPERARALANDIRLEVTARLRPACMGINVSREDPTVTEPVKITRKVYELNAQPGTTIWRLVQVSTGKVLISGKPYKYR
jgi:hypothetical protein